MQIWVQQIGGATKNVTSLTRSVLLVYGHSPNARAQEEPDPCQQHGQLQGQQPRGKQKEVVKITGRPPEHGLSGEPRGHLCLGRRGPLALVFFRCPPSSPELCSPQWNEKQPAPSGTPLSSGPLIYTYSPSRSIEGDLTRERWG